MLTSLLAFLLTICPGGVFGLSNVAGPLLGGAFTDKLTWRWCFYINLPIGAVAVLVIIFFFPDPRPQRVQRPESFREQLMYFDPIGTLIFIPAVVCLLLALTWGGTTYPWSDARIIALFVVAGVVLVAWVGVQYYQQDLATVPPRIFKQRTIWSASLFSFALSGAVTSVIFFLPIWFQAVKGASAVDSGLMNLPLLLSVVVFSLIAGGLVTLWGYYVPFMILGTVLVSVSFGLISTFQPDTGRPVWIG